MVLLDFLGDLDIAVPVGQGEAAFVAFEVVLELIAGVDDAGVVFAEGFSAFQEGVLDVLQRVGDRREEVGAFDALLVFGALVAAGHEDAVVVHVALADFQPDGHAFLDPAPGLFAAAEITGVEFDADGLAVIGRCLEVLGELLAVVQHGLGVVGFEGDGHDDHVRGGELGRQHEAVVVAVGHDEPADQAGGHAPAGGPGVVLLVVFAQEADVLGFGEVLA